MSFINTIARLNLLPLWRRRLYVWNFEFASPSLDRLTALFLHKLNLLGKPEKIFFTRNLKPGMTVVDIGANQGLYSLLFSRLVGAEGVVIAFEPEPDMFAALETNIAANSVENVECHRLAIGSKSDQAMLSRSLIHGGDNRLSSGHSEQISTKKPVRVATLDDIVGDRKVDFIKMDVQGWEWEAFRGMERTIDGNRDIGIHFEFWPAGLRDSGCDPLELLKFLSQQKFQIYRSGGGGETQLRDFSLLLSELSGNKFTNLYARRDRE